jgi:hypothetical protein
MGEGEGEGEKRELNHLVIGRLSSKSQLSFPLAKEVIQFLSPFCKGRLRGISYEVFSNYHTGGIIIVHLVSLKIKRI